jgi:hypothetical protein
MRKREEGNGWADAVRGRVWGGVGVGWHCGETGSFLHSKVYPYAVNCGLVGNGAQMSVAR